MTEYKRKTPVEALEDDELYKMLVDGTATPEDCRSAARWIKTLTSLLTDEKNQRMRDGYDVGDVADPEHHGQKLAALSNALTDRIVSLTQRLTPMMPRAERAKVLLELGLLLELYPMK